MQGFAHNTDTVELLVNWVRNRFFGKYRGLVTDNNDKTRRGRIKVKVPAVLGEEEVWAMPCLPYTGDGVGSYMIPQKKSGVWIEFEGGDPSFPIWVGGFWADSQIPRSEKKARVTPPVKMIRSNKGLMFYLDDKNNNIVISDSEGNNIIKINLREKKISVKSEQKVVVDAQKIELVENSVHPVVFGDELIKHLNNMEKAFNMHTHTGQAIGIIPVTANPPTPAFPSATQIIHSSRVTTG